MKKRVLSLLLCCIFVVTLLMGCSSKGTGNTNTPGSEGNKDNGSNGKGEKVTLEWETTATSEKIPVYQELIDKFTKETGIKVELVTPGNDYETVMKTRMASGDLPDIWETHGWSVARYSEYLMPLNDQKWFSRIDESILPVISDKEDNIYCLPLTIGVNTISYNKDVFKAAGVDASSIRTWKDFDDACAKIKASGVTPIFLGNKDSSTIAQLCEDIPPAFLTTQSVEDNQKEALKNGEFDFAKYWTPISEIVDSWMQKGYFNKDVLTSDNDAGCQALAKGECGMIFGGGNNILFARTYNPDANLGYLACPGVNEDDVSFISMGEGTCVGMWKDTTYPEESKKFLEFLSQVENCEKVATSSGDIPGLKDVKNEDAYITQAFREAQTMYKGDIEYVPLFDREYLPSGMWDDLGVGMTKLIMEPGKAVKDSVEYLQDAYNNKMIK